MGIRTKEFYKFQNKVMEKLRETNLSPNESKYCWTLFRKTCGYGDYKAEISRSDISDFTHISETHVSDTEQRLKSRNIIIVRGKLKGFNPDISKWEKVQLSGHFKKVQLSGLKGPAIRTKKVQLSGPSLSTKRKKTQEGQDFYKMLSRKEIEKLESDRWYRAVMWNYGRFSKEYIEKTIKDYDYNTRMSCWYIYEDSGNIRDKEAFFSHLLRKYKEDLEA